MAVGAVGRLIGRAHGSAFFEYVVTGAAAELVGRHGSKYARTARRPLTAPGRERVRPPGLAEVVRGRGHRDRDGPGHTRALGASRRRGGLGGAPPAAARPLAHPFLRATPPPPPRGP